MSKGSVHWEDIQLSTPAQGWRLGKSRDPLDLLSELPALPVSKHKQSGGSSGKIVSLSDPT
jgi:hypothetical protein